MTERDCVVILSLKVDNLSGFGTYHPTISIAHFGGCLRENRTMVPHYYDEQQQDIFWAIIFSISVFSIMGSFAIIFSYILFPQIRSANSRIIVSLRYISFLFVLL
jgi:hypothetical protein